MNISRSFLHPALAAFALGTVLALCAPAYADVIPGYPDDSALPQEEAALPPYCYYTNGFAGNSGRSAEKAHWESVIGYETFRGLHHYCRGLFKTSRALYVARSPKIRNYLLESSLGEFDYVINIAPPDFILLPEMFTKKGENLLRLKKPSQAVQEFMRAIELKPDYWPPYASLSDYYKEIGDIAKARETLAKGLEYSPDSKSLKTRLTELGAPKGPKRK